MTVPDPPASAAPLPSAVLEDPAYRVPCGRPGERGLDWLRASVVRFSEGADHVRRRALTVGVIEQVMRRPVAPAGSPVASLLRALDLPAELAPDVALVAAAYQPHAPQSGAADAAADRLVEACGGRTERAAARVCVLVQAQAGMGALLAARSAGVAGPPIPVTRRLAPDATVVEVDLVDAHFGRGAHRCPGETLAEQLAEPRSAGAGEPGAQVGTNIRAESPTAP